MLKIVTSKYSRMKYSKNKLFRMQSAKKKSENVQGKLFMITVRIEYANQL